MGHCILIDWKWSCKLATTYIHHRPVRSCNLTHLSTNHFALLYLFDVFVKVHCSLVEELSWDITDQELVEYQNDLQFKQTTNYLIHTPQTHSLPLALLDTGIWQSQGQWFFVLISFSSHRKADYYLNRHKTFLVCSMKSLIKLYLK